MKHGRSGEIWYIKFMIAALFPGQGSQAPGMGKSFFDHSAASRDVFQRISEAVGRNLQEICFEFDEETLRQTDNAQIALFTASLAAYAAYQTSGKSADLFAGHSIGEYAALVASGCIPLAVGAKLVQKRGELMAAAKSGGMAAVLGLDIPAIEEALKQVEGTVVVANDNCPGQVVISGDATAVIEAVPVLQSAGAKRVLPLNVSGAFHSPLMQDAADEFALSLAQVEFMAGRVVSNVTASEVTDANQWAGLLETQLRGRVRWTESVQTMIAMGTTEFIEFGNGEVLCGMLKRIDKSIMARSVQNIESLN